jgi:hypothetical protein
MLQVGATGIDRQTDRHRQTDRQTDISYLRPETDVAYISVSQPVV